MHLGYLHPQSFKTAMILPQHSISFFLLSNAHLYGWYSFCTASLLSCVCQPSHSRQLMRNQNHTDGPTDCMAHLLPHGHRNCLCLSAATPQMLPNIYVPVCGLLDTNLGKTYFQHWTTRLQSSLSRIICLLELKICFSPLLSDLTQVTNGIYIWSMVWKLTYSIGYSQKPGNEYWLLLYIFQSFFLAFLLRSKE